MRPCLIAVAVLLLLLCSVVTLFADDLTYTGTQCAFDAQGPDGPTCDISPGETVGMRGRMMPSPFATGHVIWNCIIHELISGTSLHADGDSSAAAFQAPANISLTPETSPCATTT
jgi:hypothetical protein